MQMLNPCSFNSRAGVLDMLDE
uniref:Uncharacterized protein n=1 Tax=Arundo donax TaxID=35708 RepID=A0A0A8Z7X1_ARUDO